MMDVTVTFDNVGVQDKEESAFDVKILMLKGEPGAAATDSQVISAVNAWLEDHPEATTTVEDGSITLAKLSNSLKDIAFETVEKQIELVFKNNFMSTSGVLTAGGQYAVLDVLKNQKYKIKARTGSSVVAYVLLSNNTVIDYYSTEDPYPTDHDYDIEYTVPNNGKLYINTYTWQYAGLKQVVDVLENELDVEKNSSDIVNLLSSVQLNKSRNIFDGDSLVGFRNGADVNTSSTYRYSKPIFLQAGSYIFTDTSTTFGDNGKWPFYVNQEGVVLGTGARMHPTTTLLGNVSQSGLYNNRPIRTFTLDVPAYLSFNLGVYSPYVNTTSNQVANFALIEGSTLADWFSYEPGYKPFWSPKYGILNGLSGLLGKCAIFDGDSICEGRSIGDTTTPTYGYGWAGRIGISNSMAWRNYGVGGGVITSASVSALSGRHSLVDNIDNLGTEYPDADYIVLEGGTNDADLLGNAISDPSVLGTLSPLDFSGSYNIKTFTGALETIFYKATNYWRGKHIGFIVAQKMGVNNSGYSGTTNNRRAYFERAIDVCKKWGIPFLDLWNDCYLNPLNPNCYNQSLTSAQNIAQGYLYTDGQHLTKEGYDYISSIVEDWMKKI